MSKAHKALYKEIFFTFLYSLVNELLNFNLFLVLSRQRVNIYLVEPWPF